MDQYKGLGLVELNKQRRREAVAETSKRNRLQGMAKRRALSDDSEESDLPLSMFSDLTVCIGPLSNEALKQLNLECMVLTREKVAMLFEKEYLFHVVAALQSEDTRLAALSCLINISFAPRACTYLQQCVYLFDLLNLCLVSPDACVVVHALYVVNNFYGDDEYDVAFVAFQLTRASMVLTFNLHAKDMDVQTNMICAMMALTFPKITSDYEQVLIDGDAMKVVLQPLLFENPILPKVLLFEDTVQFDEFAQHFLELIYHVIEKHVFSKSEDLLRLMQFPFQMFHAQPNVLVFCSSLKCLTLVSAVFREADIAIDVSNPKMPLMSAQLEQRGNKGSFVEYMFIQGNFVKGYCNFLKTLEQRPTLCSDATAKECLNYMTDLMMFSGKTMVMDVSPMLVYIGNVLIPAMTRPLRREHALNILFQAAKTIKTPDYYEWLVEKCNMLGLVTAVLRHSVNAHVMLSSLTFLLNLIRYFPSSTEMIAQIPGMVDQLMTLRYDFDHNKACAEAAEHILQALDAQESDEEDFTAAPFMGFARSAFVV